MDAESLIIFLICGGPILVLLILSFFVKHEHVDVFDIEPYYTRNIDVPGMDIYGVRLGESDWTRLKVIAKSRGVSRDKLIAQAIAGGTFDMLMNETDNITPPQRGTE